MSRHWLHLDSSPFVIISGAVASLDPGPSGRSSLQRHRSDRQRDEKGLQTRKMAESGRSGRRGLAAGVGGSGADSRGIHTSDLPRGDLDHSRGRCRAFRRAFRDRRVSVDFRGSGGFQRGSFGGRRRLRGVGNRGDFERRNKMRRRLSGDVDGTIVATGAESPVRDSFDVFFVNGYLTGDETALQSWGFHPTNRWYVWRREMRGGWGVSRAVARTWWTGRASC